MNDDDRAMNDNERAAWSSVLAEWSTRFEDLLAVAARSCEHGDRGPFTELLARVEALAEIWNDCTASREMLN